MSRTQSLPLYSSAYLFTREIYRIRTKLPKSLKFDLGQEAFHSSIKILKCIVLANAAKEKELHLRGLLLEIEVQWLFLRLLYDFKGISEGEFKTLSERLSDITKQSKAWAKWQKSGGTPVVPNEKPKTPGIIGPVARTDKTK
jgi:hypothetical protein